MKTRELSPRLFVAGQITASDVGIAAAQGVKTIICNRPDSEAADQPSSHEIAKAASGHGIEFVYVPVVSGSISDDNVRDFTLAYESAVLPILAYCQSGMRSTCLWAMSEVSSQGVDTVLAAAFEAGYDLAGLRLRLESLAK